MIKERIKTLPKKFLTLYLLVSLLSFIFLSGADPVRSDEVTQLEGELQQTEQELNSKSAALAATQKKISEILSSSTSVAQKIKSLGAEITIKDQLIAEKESSIQQRSSSIDATEASISDKREKLKGISRTLYVNVQDTSILSMLKMEQIERITQLVQYKRYVFSIHTSDAKTLSDTLDNLQKERESLEAEKAAFLTEKEELAKSKTLLESELAALKAQQYAQSSAKKNLEQDIGSLKSKISDLQQAILIAKSGAYVPSVGSVPIGPDYAGSAAGFRELAPAGYFAVFSIGAYTHRNGMSQWGAKARDDAGQTYQQILSSYYPGTTIRTGSVNINGNIENITENITVGGFGTMPFEAHYLHGIREIDPAWNNSSDINVLKAQAIAARTYAVRYTSNGRNQICASQSCQVYSSTHHTGAWLTAVAETAGMILTDGNGVPVSTQYAAVHGGWVNNVGWDTTDGQGSGDWLGRAWEGLSGVSWLYKAWYRSGTSSTGASCGRQSWISPEEMSDLINAWLVTKGIDVVGTVDQSRIIPVTIQSCPIGGLSGNPYSMAEMRALLSNPVTSINGLPVVIYNGSGSSTSVNFNTNRGTITIPADEFKGTFNFRAPGYLSIPQSSFTHINIERK